MGGFAGGDEGGYWDDDSVAIFKNELKNTNRKKVDIQTGDGSYRYDTISFVLCKCKNFTIEGYDDASLELNSIYRAYKALSEFTNDSDIEDFFYEYKVVVSQGTSSPSDAVAFIILLKEVCNLVLSAAELEEIQSNLK